VDSAIVEVQFRLGRGKGNHVAQSLENARHLHALSIRIKLNSVITRLNHHEDMSAFVRQVRPDRWKIFQVLPVAGQNDGKVTPLLISAVEFQRFVDRHQHLRSAGVTLAPETNDDMTGSYAMIDPLGRFFSNVGGRHHYSRPILEVGARAAFGDVAYDAERFARRGGLYDWGVPLQLSARHANPQ
jgi:radical S-adenosyl methionine domain-containing protein 2